MSPICQCCGVDVETREDGSHPAYCDKCGPNGCELTLADAAWLREQLATMKMETDKDYDGMREFQGKFVKADQDWRAAVEELEAVKKERDEYAERLQFLYGHRSLANQAAKDIEEKLKDYDAIKKRCEAMEKTVLLAYEVVGELGLNNSIENLEKALAALGKMGGK